MLPWRAFRSWHRIVLVWRHWKLLRIFKNILSLFEWKWIFEVFLVLFSGCSGACWHNEDTRRASARTSGAVARRFHVLLLPLLVANWRTTGWRYRTSQGWKQTQSKVSCRFFVFLIYFRHFFDYWYPYYTKIIQTLYKANTILKKHIRSSWPKNTKTFPLALESLQNTIFDGIFKVSAVNGNQWIDIFESIFVYMATT